MQTRLEEAYYRGSQDERKKLLTHFQSAAKIRIRGRIEWLVNDCATFRRLRCEQTDWYLREGLGGGNVMMAVTLFAAINFLAKVNSYLEKPERFTSKAEHKADKDTLKAARIELPQFSIALDNLKPRSHGECVEQNAFYVFVKALASSGINLGFAGEKESELVWKGFRNMLTHMAHPSKDFTVETFTLAGANRESIIADRPLAFSKKDDGGWNCNVDRFAFDLMPIAEWVCEKVDQCQDYKRVIPIGYWLVECQAFPVHWTTVEDAGHSAISQ